ncbi:glutaminase, partial [Pseudomonas alloputida]
GCTCSCFDGSGHQSRQNQKTLKGMAFRVGLPGKSGVGGGIVAIVPGQFTVCVWSPELNAAGNSLAGMAALELLSSRIGWSVF